MDRLAAHVVATAVLTAALAAVPTAMANPTSAGPSVKPAVRTTSTSTTSTNTTTAATRATASPSPSPSLSASPSASPSPTLHLPLSLPLPLPLKPNHVEPVPCPDAQQLGGTAYARWHGAVAFSVKLYHSPKCHEFYGYAYPWLQFRSLKVHYDLGMGVFDVTHDAIDGARTFLGGAGGPDFWSSPVTVPAGTCTQALAHVFYPDTETDTFSAKVCV